LAENLKLYGDYREVLVGELRRRQTLCPHYSVRDFAKDIGLSPAHMSRVLNKKRGLSKTSAIKVVAALGLNSYKGSRFVFHVQALSARRLGMRFLARQGLKRPKIYEAKAALDAFASARPTWLEQAKLAADQAQIIRRRPWNRALELRLWALGLSD
jgi:hypothetical protein